jgi:hypothetical protein
MLSIDGLLQKSCDFSGFVVIKSSFETEGYGFESLLEENVPWDLKSYLHTYAFHASFMKTLWKV